MCVVRDYQRHVTLLSNHRIGFIRFALVRPCRGVGVNVGNDAKLFILAYFPERHESRTVEMNVTALQTIRVKVIIINRADYPRAFLPAQEKRPAFAFVPATPMQLSCEVEPEYVIDFDFSSHGNRRSAGLPS